MTAFEITLICIILYILDWVFILKHWDENDQKPKTAEEWFGATVLSFLIGLLIFIIGTIIYFVIQGLSQVDWHSYFTQKIL